MNLSFKEYIEKNKNIFESSFFKNSNMDDYESNLRQQESVIKGLEKEIEEIKQKNEEIIAALRVFISEIIFSFTAFSI